MNHPASDVFPMLDGDAYAALKADIAAHGLREPIAMFDSKVLDGRNRYRACRELKIKPVCRDLSGQVDPVAYVISMNLHRRHLTQDQRAMVAAKVKPLYEKAAKERKVEAGKAAGRGRPKQAAQKDVANRAQPNSETPSGKSRDQAGAALKVSGKKVDAARTIQRHSKELAAAVERGEKTLAQATREIARERKRKEIEAKAKSNSNPANDADCRILCGDCIAELAKIKAGSVRLAFADPPYNVGIDYGDGEKADKLPADTYLAWCSEWMALVVATLSPDGSFWAMINDEWADQFGVMLRGLGLHRRSWIKWYETFGVNQANNFNRCSRHIFYMTKSRKEFVFNPDAVSRPSDRLAKYNDRRADPNGKIWDDVWQVPRVTGTSTERIPDFPTQVPLAITRAIVGCASEPGDLVLDPFSGSASTGVACVEFSRRYLGIEKNPAYAKASRLRLKGTSNVDSP